MSKNQIACVRFNENKNLVIEAGAGAGKTHVLAQRVLYLVKDLKVEPFKIFVVTFSRDAALNLEERIYETFLSSKDPSLIRLFGLINISTIDALFETVINILYPKWLQKEGLPLYKHSRLELASEESVFEELQIALKRYIDKYSKHDKKATQFVDFLFSSNLDGSIYTPLKDLLKLMTSAEFIYAKKVNLDIVSNANHPYLEDFIGDIHDIARSEYLGRLRSGKLTFNDRLVFISQNMPMLSFLEIKELIVDEYQDTSWLQHDVLFSILKKMTDSRMLVVGDPKQSIYGFRGADVDVFGSLKESHDWTLISLQTNYRSKPELLNEINDLSEIVFSYKKGLPAPCEESKSIFTKYVSYLPMIPKEDISKELSPSLEFLLVSLGENLNFKSLKDFSLECYAEFISDYILKKKISLSQVAILSETNKVLSDISKILMTYGIKCRFEKESNNAKNEENFFLGVKLLKVYLKRATVIDLYEVLAKDIFDFSIENLETFFMSLKKGMNHSIFKDFFSQSTLADLNLTKNKNDVFNMSFDSLFDSFILNMNKARLIGKDNFFLGFQEFLRIVSINSSYSYDEICTFFEPFIDSLRRKLISPHFRELLEKALLEPDLLSFDYLSKEFSCEGQIKTSKPHNSSGLTLKTIHGAKGLEWPIVFFIPSKQRSGGLAERFISFSREEERLKVLLTLKNTAKLSVLLCDRNNIINPKIYNDATAFFERQRSLYTAFTRAKKTLVLMQPMLAANSKRGLLYDIEIFLKAKKTKQDIKRIENFDLDRFTYVKFLSKHFSNFDFQNSSQSSFELQSHNGNILLHHCTQLKNSERKLFIERESSQLNTVEYHDIEPIKQNYASFKAIQENNFDEFLNKVKIASPLKLLEKIQNNNKQRLFGILKHSRLVTKSYGIIEDIEKLCVEKSYPYFHELDLWEKINSPCAILPFTTRRFVADFFCLIDFESFTAYFPSRLPNTAIKTSPPSHQNAKKNRLVGLVIEFKTGKHFKHYEEQILNYMSLIEKARGYLKSRYNLDRVDTNFEVFGVIYYLRKEKKDDYKVYTLSNKDKSEI